MDPRGQQNRWDGTRATLDERKALYAVFEDAYQGAMVTRQAGAVRSDLAKRLRYNLNVPICNMAAEFTLGEGLTWNVRGAGGTDKALTDAAQEIWDRSLGDAAFGEAALSAIICGDILGIVKKPKGAMARLDWVHAAHVDPRFDPHDYNILTEAVIEYDLPDHRTYRQEWTDEGWRVLIAGEEVESGRNPTRRMPLVWIPNLPIKGQAFGNSELASVIDLIAEYNHVAAKQTKIVDYYASPKIVVRNVAPNSVLTGDVKQVLYLKGENTDAYFLEWKGNTPAVDEHLNRIRQNITEVSQTPAIAFGRIDSGFSSATGVSLKVLYGPLIAKTRRRRNGWAPRLERLMAMALEAEGRAVSPEDVELVWPNAAPHDDLEQVGIQEAKQRLGVSKRQSLIELGYDETEIEKMAGETAAEQEAQLEQQRRAFNSGQEPMV